MFRDDSQPTQPEQPTAAARHPSTPLRSSAKPKRDPALDGLRGLAILLIFVYHYGGGLQSHNPIVQTLGYVTESGWTGVVLFFALSGFLITGILWDSMGQKHLLWNFYIRRVLRIAPLYFAALLAATLYSFLSHTNAPVLKTGMVYALFLQDLPFVNNFVQAHPMALPLYHLWSLAVEEQFYLLWPALLLLAETRREARKSALTVFVMATVFCNMIWWMPAFGYCRQYHLFDQFVLTHAGAFALGAAVALALRSKNKSGRVGSPHRFIRHWAGTAFAGGLAVYLLVSWVCHSLYLSEPLQFTLGLPAVAVACVSLIPIMLRHGLPRSAFSLAPLAWMGRISYGFYVFHILLQPLFDHLTVKLVLQQHGSAYQTTRFFVAFFLTLGVSWLSYNYFELPILRLNRFFPMGKAVTAGMSAVPPA